MNLKFDFAPATRWGIHFLILFALVLALYFGRALFLPVVIAMMLATVLYPASVYLHRRWHMPQALAGLTVILVLIVFSGLGIFWGMVAIQSLVQDLRSGQELLNAYNGIHRVVNDLDPDLAKRLVPENHEESVFFIKADKFIQDQIDESPGYLVTASTQILLILFLVLFILVEGDMLMRRTVEIFGPSSGPDSLAALKALRETARQIRSYLVWRTVINICMTLFLGVVYSQLELKQAWTWAVLAGILTYVPYIGPVVAGIPALIDAFLVGGPGTAAIVFAIYMLVLLIEGYVVFPLVIGRNMEMNATTVMFACLFWWVVWGEIGVFLALPLTAGIRAICTHVPGWRPWANLMGMEGTEPGSSSWIYRLISWMFPGFLEPPEPEPNDQAAKAAEQAALTPPDAEPKVS